VQMCIFECLGARDWVEKMVPAIMLFLVISQKSLPVLTMNMIGKIQFLSLSVVSEKAERTNNKRPKILIAELPPLHWHCTGTRGPGYRHWEALCTLCRYTVTGLAEEIMQQSVKTLFSGVTTK
jgi:hypothetical protein